MYLVHEATLVGEVAFLGIDPILFWFEATKATPRSVNRAVHRPTSVSGCTVPTPRYSRPLRASPTAKRSATVVSGAGGGHGDFDFDVTPESFGEGGVVKCFTISVATWVTPYI